MKFYIASSFKNIEQVRSLASQLKLNGWTHTYDWTQHGRANSLEKLADIGSKEISAVKDADMLVVLLPAGKGSHIELGIALGLGKRIYLYSPNDDIYDYDLTSTFYHVKDVCKFVGEFEMFLTHLLNESPTKI